MYSLLFLFFFSGFSCSSVPIQARNFSRGLSLDCGVTDKLEDGEYATIESRNYPNYYPNKHNCVWTIITPPQASVYISCDTFDVRSGDLLTVGNIELAGRSNEDESWGFDVHPVMSDNKLTIRFKTNKRGSGAGFSGGTSETTQSPVTEDPGLDPGTCSCGLANHNTRIVGGEVTEPNEYPWQVALVTAGRSHPWCGGTLISPRHILTAAHCTDEGRSSANMAVLLGEHKITDNKYDRRSISAINLHPEYNQETYDNDYAILTLTEPVTFTEKIRPACLPADSSQDYTGLDARVSGWGRTTSGGNQPDRLKDIEVTIQSLEDCTKYYPDSWITTNMICAAHLGRDSCQGDSGGPMVVLQGGRYTLAGVVSWGYSCAADPRYPGVYAKVTSQLDWILENTKETQVSC